MNNPFELHPRLAADTYGVGHWPLSQVLLLNDARYPWFLLVPRVPGLREMHELDHDQRHRLSDESAALSRALLTVFGGDKLNIAAIGNLVPQLHVHHIVRFASDDAWPQPVWGRGPAQPYSDDEAQARRVRVAEALAADGWPLSA